MTNFVNLTPHSITIDTPNGTITVPPSGTVVRVRVDEAPAGAIMGIPLVSRSLGAVEGLPDAADNDVIYIVSGFVYNSLQECGIKRSDVVAPDTGATAERDDNGRIVAVRRLLAL